MLDLCRAELSELLLLGCDQLTNFRPLGRRSHQNLMGCQQGSSSARSRGSKNSSGWVAPISCPKHPNESNKEEHAQRKGASVQIVQLLGRRPRFLARAKQGHHLTTQTLVTSPCQEHQPSGRGSTGCLKNPCAASAAAATRPEQCQLSRADQRIRQAIRKQRGEMAQINLRVP